MGKSFKLLYYLLFCLVIMYIIYNFDTFFEVIGIKSPKMKLRDLNGYFYNETVNMHKLLKPKIFIHVPIERNQRNWESFGSRTSNDLNLSIVYLCLKSVIQTCGHKYDVILFDNDNMVEMLEKYDLHDDCSQKNYKSLSSNELKHWENYCKAQILYKFGGTMMSPYFYFRSCPGKDILSPSDFRVTSYVNEGLKSTNEEMVPCAEYFMSSNKKNDDLKIYIEYLYHLCLTPHLFEHDKFEKIYKHLKNLKQIDPKLFCILNANEEPIYHTDWISANKDLQMSPKHFCVYVNVQALNTQTINGWFLKMSPEQVKTSNTNIGHYLKHYE